MVTIDEKEKVVVITNEGPIESATYSFDELDQIERISPTLHVSIVKRVKELRDKSLTPKQRKSLSREELVNSIRDKLKEGSSKSTEVYTIIINKNNHPGDKSRRHRCPGFVAIYHITPEDLYMSAWDDWSSGQKYSWDLTNDLESLINEAKNASADDSEVWIRDAVTNEVIYYHRGKDY